MLFFPRRYFQQYLDDDGGDEILALSARIGLATCFDQQGQHAEAAAAYKSAAEADNFKSAELYYAAARSSELAGNLDQARSLLQKVVDDYPDSPVFSKAKSSLSELQG